MFKEGYESGSIKQTRSPSLKLDDFSKDGPQEFWSSGEIIIENKDPLLQGFTPKFERKEPEESMEQEEEEGSLMKQVKNDLRGLNFDEEEKLLRYDEVQAENRRLLNQVVALKEENFGLERKIRE